MGINHRELIVFRFKTVYNIIIYAIYRFRHETNGT